MEIKRDRYLNKLISYMWDSQVKVITGIRRCGKSYLLRNLFHRYLVEQGVPEDHILTFALDLTRDIRYRDPWSWLAGCGKWWRGKGSGSTSLWTRSRCPMKCPTPTTGRGRKSPSTTPSTT